MYNQQHSASLEITEVNNDFVDISNVIDPKKQSNQPIQPSQQDLQNQIFQLSLDQNSLSFHIQHQKKQLNNPKITSVDSQQHQQQKQNQKSLSTHQEERKRKRRALFQKYKQQSTQNFLNGLDFSVENKFLETFDQVFQIKSPEKTQKLHQPLKKFPSLSEENLVSHFEPESNVFRKKSTNEQSKINKAIPLKEIQQKGLETQFLDKKQPQQLRQNKHSNSDLNIPSDISQKITIDYESNVVMSSTHSFVVESQPHKISAIQPIQQQYSRDSSDLESILKSQIFREGLASPRNNNKNSQHSYKSIDVTSLNPSIMLKTQETIPSQNYTSESSKKLISQKSSQNLRAPITKPQKSLKHFVSQKNLRNLPYVNRQRQLSIILKENFKIESTLQNRIPDFLKQIRRQNAIIPNFALLQLRNSAQKNYLYRENMKLKQLLMQFKQCIIFLDQINQQIFDRYLDVQSKTKKLLSNLTTQTFLKGQWLKYIPIDNNDIERLMPKQNYVKRKYSYKKVKQALSNYQQIVDYYGHKNLNLQDKKAQKKYLDIRNKFWQIEKNIKMISQDIYSLYVQPQLPEHYLQYYGLLRGQIYETEKSRKEQYLRQLLRKYYVLRNEGDILCNSQVGEQIRTTLQSWLYKLSVK